MQVTFELLEVGRFPEASVQVSWTNDEAASNEESRRLVDEAWAEAEADAEANGRLLYDGALCRLVDWRQANGNLSLRFGATTYRAFVGTQLRRPIIGDKFGAAFIANATGVCAALITADNDLVLQRRSDRVFENPGFYHVCGGQLEPANVDGQQSADPFGCVRRELLEEFDIPQREISRLQCLGLARDRLTRKPELLFAARTDLATSQVVSVKHEEYSDIHVLQFRADDLAKFLMEHATCTVPVGLACLLRLGAEEFGETWAEHVVTRIS